MIRIVLFLISVLLIAWGFAWVADRPGEVAITWMGYRVETSVIVAAFAVAVLVPAPSAGNQELSCHKPWSDRGRRRRPAPRAPVRRRCDAAFAGRSARTA